MSVSQVRTSLIMALFFISLGGFLLHLRIHPITMEVERTVLKSADGLETSPKIEVTQMVKVVVGKNLIPFFSGLLSMTVVIAMFCFKSTASYAYLINGMFVILGTITMAHFSISKMSLPLTLDKITLFSTFADIMILFGKFYVSKAIFETYFIKEAVDVLINPK